MDQNNYHLGIVQNLVSSLTKIDISDITLDKKLADIGKWDSLNHIQMVCGIEKFLNRQLKLHEIISATTVKDWVKILDNY